MRPSGLWVCADTECRPHPPPGERPFHCTLCEKAFNQKSALQVHMKKHTGERPYKCDYCIMGFTQKSNMKLHMKRAHSYTGKLCAVQPGVRPSGGRGSGASARSGLWCSPSAGSWDKGWLWVTVEPVHPNAQRAGTAPTQHCCWPSGVPMSHPASRDAAVHVGKGRGGPLPHPGSTGCWWGSQVEPLLYA